MEAWRKRGILTLKYPVEHGFVVNWDDYEKIMHSMFYNSLRRAPEEHAFVQIISANEYLKSNANREKHCQIAFETFNVPAYLQLPTPLAALYALSEYTQEERKTGVVVSVGGTSTSVTCVIEGELVKSSFQIMHTGGAHVTDRLLHSVTVMCGEWTHPKDPPAGGGILLEIKKKLCFVAPSVEFIKEYDLDEQRRAMVDLEVPVGAEDANVKLGLDFFMPAEVFFEGENPLPLLIFNAISECPKPFRSILCDTIVLEGRTSLLPGFGLRIQRELRKFFREECTVISLPQRGELAYIGASRWATTFKEIDGSSLISNEEYNEYGPTYVHVKHPVFPKPGAASSSSSGAYLMGQTLSTLTTSATFSETRFLDKFNSAMKTLSKALNPQLHVSLPMETSHGYLDKFRVANELTSLLTVTVKMCLKHFGLNEKIIDEVRELAKNKQITLRFTHDQTCVLKEKREREIVEKTSLVTKQVRTITEYFWNAEAKYAISIFAGTDVDHAIRLESHVCGIEEILGTYTSPRLAKQHGIVDADVTWLFQPEKQTINLNNSSCRTPRRNPTVDAALLCCQQLDNWLCGVFNVLSSFGSAQHYTTIMNAVFNPIVPLFFMDKNEIISTPLELASEHGRSLQEALGVVDIKSATECKREVGKALLGPHECRSVSVLRHCRDLVQAYIEGVDYVEGMLRTQIVRAIGKVVTSRDFDEYMRFHYRSFFREQYRPIDFCYALRRSDKHDAEGMVNLFCDKIPVETFTFQYHSDMEFPLNAAAIIKLGGPRFVHGWLSHEFGQGSAENTFELNLRARQFGCFVVVLGVVAGPNSFDPKHAIIVQNTEDLTIPLNVETIPSPKEFADAIASLSPTQQAFCKAFRSMQLASSLFGIVIIQVKPQLEKLLKLPNDSLTQEIELTQDLLKLFIDYQLPSDLLMCSPEAPDKIAEVKALVQEWKSLFGDFDKPSEILDDRSFESELALVRAQRARDLAQPLLFPDMLIYNSEETQGEPLSIIMDIGTHLAKGGYGGSSTVEEESMVMVGRPRHRGVMVGMGQKDAYSGGGGVESSNLLGDASPPAPGSDAPAEPTTSTPLLGSNRTDPVQLLQFDVTTIPNKLEALYGLHDKEGAVRPCILSTGVTWRKSGQSGLVADRMNSILSKKEQAREKNRAFDLLDALSQSGGLSIDHAELHVLVTSRHCSAKSVMDGLVQESINPIEKVTQSTLLLASTIFQTPPGLISIPV